MFARQMRTLLPSGEQSKTDEAAFLNAATLGLVVFAAALFGIFTRPVGQLSAFWIANAVLLGILVRNPRLASPFGLLSAAAGFVAADIVTGGDLTTTLLLTGANLCGVVAGYFAFSFFDEADKRLERPFSIFCLVTVSIVGGAAAGVVGAVVNPLLFGGMVLSGWLFWFVAELVNYIAILPVILSAPTRPLQSVATRREKELQVDLWRLAPALALALSCIAGLIIGGPGAVTFPVPALLWCALVYSVFATAVLTLLFSAWTLLAISMGYLSLSFDNSDWQTVMSIRLGVTLMALAPLTLASVTAARNILLSRLQHVATHDQLTGVLNRSAFVEEARSVLSRLAAEKQPATVLMLDIDKFKTINDTYGHAAGDRVLQVFAGLTEKYLREGDVFGRIGGEEFAILLTACPRAGAEALAEHMRILFAACTVETDSGPISATVSIGAAFATPAIADVEPLLLVADKALYRAKESGRNRVEGSEFAAEIATWPTDRDSPARRQRA